MSSSLPLGEGASKFGGSFDVKIGSFLRNTTPARFRGLTLVLLLEGFAGMDRELSALDNLDTDKEKVVGSLREYLSKHKERLRYAERLAAGRSIGSGLIEGACKNLVKRRLKQTGACWRVPRANRIAVICAALYSDQWDDCWKNYH